MAQLRCKYLDILSLKIFSCDFYTFSQFFSLRCRTLLCRWMSSCLDRLRWSQRSISPDLRMLTDISFSCHPLPLYQSLLESMAKNDFFDKKITTHSIELVVGTSQWVAVTYFKFLHCLLATLLVEVWSALEWDSWILFYNSCSTLHSSKILSKVASNKQLLISYLQIRYLINYCSFT